MNRIQKGQIKFSHVVSSAFPSNFLEMFIDKMSKHVLVANLKTLKMASASKLFSSKMSLIIKKKNIRKYGMRLIKNVEVWNTML